ncbi:hypothetical protein ABW20_dc0106840 [Dactylellina cionopaga]|nr:hypothetical protein ABW20_dc0106840 [Dactylellina cionopaga]
MSLPSEDAIPSHLRNPSSPLPLNPGALSATPQSLAAKYRGAVIADLDLAPALSVPPQQSISEALAMSYDRSYDQLTVINPQNRSLLGYLSIPRLKQLLQSKALTEEDTVEEAMTRFRKGKGVKYTVITPETELAELEEFLTSGGGKDSGFAVVTDVARKFVLAVATIDDLENFAKRRG